MGNGNNRKKFRGVLGWAVCWGAVVIAAGVSIAQPFALVAVGKDNAGSEAVGIRIENQSQHYPMLDGDPEGKGGDYIALSVPEAAVYEVEAGDTLWGIARKSYGRGSAWHRIEAANRDVVGENALIFPGTGLVIPRTYYIKKQVGSWGGFSAPACSYDTPAEWIFSYPKWEVCLESVYWQENPEDEVYIHITENRMFPDGVGESWEEMQARIKESAERIEKKEDICFSEPRFERYLREDGRELLFYSFLCIAEGEKIQYAVAYVAGKKYLAEFIGCCPLSEAGGEVISAFAIEEITRYMAASFAETEEEKSWASLKYRPYLGAGDWAYEDLHNPFAMAAERYAPEEDPVYPGEDVEITFVSKEWENLLRTAIAYHYDMSEEEREELSHRLLRASELAWITKVTMVESPIPGRDQVSVNTLSPKDATCAQYNLTTLKDIAVLPNLEKLELEIGGVSDYEVLGDCPSLREISIISAEQLTEMEWLCQLPQLEYLSLRISMFPYLYGMGYEKEGETTFANGDNPGKGDGGELGGMGDGAGRELEKVLGKCTSLKYLELEDSGMEDFGFINKLPDLYAFRLLGEDRDSEEAAARRSCFGVDDYPQVKCLVVDEKWLRNPE